MRLAGTRYGSRKQGEQHVDSYILISFIDRLDFALEKQGARFSSSRRLLVFF